MQDIAHAKTLCAKYENDTAMMLFSAITYCSVKGTAAVTMQFYLGDDWKLEWESPEEGTQHYAMIAYNEKIDTHVLAFRGTRSDLSFDSLHNWVQDFEVEKQVPWLYPGTPGNPMISIGASKGFSDLTILADKNAPHLTIIQYLKGRVKNLWVTGHSLGGPLAVLFASWLHYELADARPNFNVVTFAGPSIGNPDFAAQYNSKFPGLNSRSYINPLDVVPYMAGKVDQIPTLFDGKTHNTPMGAKIGAVEYFFHKLYKDVVEPAEKRWGKYTPVNTVMAPPRQIVYDVEGTDLQRWLSQAGHQHSHANYLEFMNWGETTPFGCVI